MRFRVYPLLLPLLGIAFPGLAKDLVRFPPGQILSYDGRLVVDVSVGDDEPDRDIYGVKLLSVADAPVNGGSPGGDAGGKLLVVRIVEDDSGEGPRAVLDELLEREGKVIPAREHPAQELEGLHQEIDTFLPLELAPPFPLPDLGSGEVGEHEVVIFNQALAKARFKTLLEKKAAGLRAVRELVESAPASFEFQASPARLKSWREEYAIDPQRGVLQAVARKFSVLVPSEESDDRGDLRLVVSFELSLKVARQLTASERELLQASAQALWKIHRHLAARKPSAEIEPGVRALAKRLAGSPLAPLAAATEQRLKSYRETFEGEDNESGRILAKLLGNQAPDFMLEDLEGKKVRFRRATEGKVTLLSFWGYG